MEELLGVVMTQVLQEEPRPTRSPAAPPPPPVLSAGELATVTAVYAHVGPGPVSKHLLIDRIFGQSPDAVQAAERCLRPDGDGRIALAQLVQLFAGWKQEWAGSAREASLFEAALAAVVQPEQPEPPAAEPAECPVGRLSAATKRREDARRRLRGAEGAASRAAKEAGDAERFIAELERVTRIRREAARGAMDSAVLCEARLADAEASYEKWQSEASGKASEWKELRRAQEAALQAVEVEAAAEKARLAAVMTELSIRTEEQAELARDLEKYTAELVIAEERIEMLRGVERAKRTELDARRGLICQLIS